MRQTLFHIPYEILGIPLFGAGWLLGLWCVACAIMAFRSYRREEFKSEAASFVMLAVGVAAAILWILPQLEEVGADDQILGVPIRGYGMFLLFGVLSGMLLAAFRAQKAGLHPDVIYSLGFWMFVAGIVGARLFFVLQYWSEFKRETIAGTLFEIVRFTEGGLVVYGSLIGALLAFLVYCHKQRLPWLAMGDIIAPSMALGLALGRLGCLMNGCCFGGVCEDGLAIQFPEGSQPYVRQVFSGELLGMRFDAGKPNSPQRIASIVSGSLADKRGLREGDEVVIRSPALAWKRALADPTKAVPVVIVESSSGQDYVWTTADLPDWSRPVHPTQIYSALNALLLCCLLLAFHPLRKRDGMTIALTLTLYPISRFLLEAIRNDEPGRFGTSLTISQWVSLGMLLLACMLWTHLYRRPAGLANLRKLGPQASP